MTLEEIKKAVESGKIVHYGNKSYQVIKDSIGQWMIKHSNGTYIGLTWADDVTLNGEAGFFFIQESNMMKTLEKIEYPVVLSTHDDQVALIENSDAFLKCLQIEFQTDINDLKIEWNVDDRCGCGTFEDDYEHTNVFEIHHLKSYS